MKTEKAVQLFADGDIESGEVLLARSGDNGDIGDMTTPAFFAALVSVFTTCNEPKACEIAAGIVANLMLHNDTNDMCIDALHIPEFLFECCTAIDDPFTIAEILRALTNIIYVGKSECLRASLPTLASFVLYLAENSLFPKLLVYVVQLIYYIPVYCTKEIVFDWDSCWDAEAFYMHILGCFSDVSTEHTAYSLSADVQSPDSEKLYSTVLLLQSESVGDCSGLEWLLLSIDRITLSQSLHSSPICESEHMLKFVVHLLLSQSTQSWETTKKQNDHSKSLGVSFSLSAAEKFLAVSVLDSIVSFRKRKVVSAPLDSSEVSVLHDLFTLSKKYASTAMSGYVTLVRALLETFEDALLMKDSYGMYASAGLLCYILEGCIGIPVEEEVSHCPTSSSAEDIPVRTFLTAHLDVLFPQIQNIAELLVLTENLDWVGSHDGQDNEKANLVYFLRIVKQSFSCDAVKPENVVNEKCTKCFVSLVHTVEKIIAHLK